MIKKIIKNIIFFIILINIFFNNILYADDNNKFLIKKINIIGVNNFSKDIIENKIKNYKNKNISKSDIKNIIKYLYDTKLFNNIKIDIKNNDLIIYINENKLINNIKFFNNKLLNNTELINILKKFNLNNNEIFNEKNLFDFKKEIKKIYINNGKFFFNIEDIIENINNNKINITLFFNEGEFTKINNVNIEGNRLLNKKSILNILDINYGLFKTVYNKNKLLNNLLKLNLIYKKKGYLNFSINKLNTKFIEKNNSIDIDLVINEGKIFLINKFIVNGNYNELHKLDINSLCNFKKNEIYNYKKIYNVKNKIKNFLLKKGYKNPKINILISNLNKNKCTLDINVEIDIQDKLNIRNIKIYGNKKTLDKVLKNKMKQKEKTEFNIFQTKSDILELNKFKYFNKINIYTKKIYKIDNLIDLIYFVKEPYVNNFSVGANLNSKTLNFECNYNNINWLGSGNSLLLKAIYNDPKYFLSCDIKNPYNLLKNNKQYECKIFDNLNTVNNNSDVLRIKDSGLSSSINNNINDKINTENRLCFSTRTINFNEFEENINEIIKKNIFNDNIPKNIIDLNKSDKYIKFNKIDLFTKMKYIYNVNKYKEKYLNISFSTDNNLLPFGINLYRLLFEYLNNNKINDYISLKNEIIFFIMPDINNKIPFYEYGLIKNYIDNIRGFKSNCIEEIDYSNIDENCENLNILKNNSKINIINEIYLPIELIFNNIKDFLKISLFIDSSNNLYLGNNIFKNILSFHDHMSFGINAKINLKIGNINTSYSIPIKYCDSNNIINFQFKFNRK
ncbi:outer membrane protein assembly factor BamA [endosymbiont of Euscepes postfasciatus]|uniref:outer membrane protein assembly factor BamA n=1 Tax=endosymbiont of Euscepes postfasciatus TaxID=650377 RepID=UPI000DC72397|nr:outer membrane protein assembly factor BamA [endosymbiont of Euscepes postfasciatus]BBA84730.1 outer membrane protein assembly factor BamA [endosymbiont of Euscepes postfasciatus]